MENIEIIIVVSLLTGAGIGVFLTKYYQLGKYLKKSKMSQLNKLIKVMNDNHNKDMHIFRLKEKEAKDFEDKKINLTDNEKLIEKAIEDRIGYIKSEEDIQNKSVESRLRALEGKFEFFGVDFVEAEKVEAKDTEDIKLNDKEINQLMEYVDEDRENVLGTDKYVFLKDIFIKLHKLKS